ncbi:MAG TPA: methyltransferase [Pyrinomonadaceae bacterium]|nr:methyltransferase [Pyrinomonadaceae bacterium]
MNTQATASVKATPAMPPELYLTQLTFGALVSQALFVAAKLGVADLLAEQPLSIFELAGETKTNERALYRVLRSLAAVGVFKEVSPKIFAMTPNAEPLRSDVPNSIRNIALFMGEEWHWRVWGNMAQSIESGKPAWGKVHGMEVFDYFQANPQQYETFNRAMTGMSAAMAPAIVEGYDFSGIETLADIAGGHGLLLAQILKANANMKGILFDLPEVIQGADALLQNEAVLDRVEKVSGNFFKTVPIADAYLLKHIIHDWDDERAIQILQNIRNMMGPDGRVLLVEVVIPEGNDPHFGKMLDLERLVSPGGVERTEEEYQQLLSDSGLQLTRIIPTMSAYSIIEAVKAH